MSKLEQNTTSLDEVLAMVNALPDAGGGGGVETCTVTLYGFDMDKSTGILTGYILTAYEDGEMTTKQLLNSSFGSDYTTIENVVCGSFITVTSSKPMDMNSVMKLDGQGYESGDPVEGAEIVWLNTGSTVAVCKTPTTPNCHILFKLHYSS